MPAALPAAIAGSAFMQATSMDDAQAQSARNANLAASYADPFHQYRSQYAPLLNNLMGTGSGPGGGSVSALASLQSSPGYQFRYNQGLQALNSSLAAKGMLNSGNRLAALQNYGQDYASQEYNNQFNRLSSLSGAANGQMGAASQNFSSNAQNSVGYGVASNNALSSGLGSLAQQYGGGGGTGSYNAGGTGGSMFNPGYSGANNAFNTGGSAFSDSSILSGV